MHQDDHTQLDKFGATLLHGKGYDRWFDKSFTLVIGKNGRVSFSSFGKSFFVFMSNLIVFF
jgi:carnitine O-palmitoyltransferase 1